MVFSERDIKLQSALSFSQYVLFLNSKHMRLLTLIGEQHELEFQCKGPKQTITEYVLQTLSSNPNSEILLEIDPNFIQDKRRWPISIPIRGILKGASKMIDRIGGYDWRNAWLDEDDREHLYHDMKYMRRLSKEDILSRYIKPFNAKYRDLMILRKDDYNSTAYEFLSVTFIANLKRSIKVIEKRVMRNWDSKGAREDLVVLLLHFWKDVTDWNLLKMILVISETNSIIAIMGEQHRKNLTRLFRNLTPLAEQKGSRVGSENGCMSLMETLHMPEK
jgi:hypothetical protein